jgi:crotonobetainyl-CoA:carnitine CoA-transferase CaiB-like acyl-CoA transferase
MAENRKTCDRRSVARECRRTRPRIQLRGLCGRSLARLPGQDLLAQARSVLMWLNGDRGQGPVPFGLAIADLLAGSAIVQGVLAALVRRGKTGEGAARRRTHR